MPPLSDSDKEKIEAEERFRQQIRKELEDPTEPSNKWIAFFNSNLGIFILTTLIVTVGSFIYEAYQQNKQDNIAAREAEEDRKFNHNLMWDETIHRFEVLTLLTDTLKQYEGVNINLAVSGQSIGDLIKVKHYNFRSNYQRFEDWTLTQLLREFYRISTEVPPESKTNVDAEVARQLLQIELQLEKVHLTIGELSSQVYITTNKRKLRKGELILDYPKTIRTSQGNRIGTGKGFIRDGQIFYLEPFEFEVKRKFFLGNNPEIVEFVNLLNDFLVFSKKNYGPAE